MQGRNGFRMDRPGQLGLPLQIDNALAADADRRRDPRRLTEGSVPEVDDRQSVHLPAGLALGFDPDDSIWLSIAPGAPRRHPAGVGLPTGNRRR